MFKKIKFRAWDNVNNWWSFYTNEDCMKNLQDRNCNITQYIWIKDKYWKEIYEGDIVVKRKYQINWWQKTRNWYIKKVVVEYRTDWSYLHYNISNDPENEIIGNIFENKQMIPKSFNK